MEANQILQSDILDILFEGKNKLYGAYYLRKTYHKRITAALVTILLLMLFSWIASVVSGKFAVSSVVSPINIPETHISEVPKDEPLPLRVFKTKSSVHVATLKVTIPVIVKNNLVMDPPPDVDQIKKSTIDFKNLSGKPGGDIVNPPSEVTGSNVLAGVGNKGTPEDTLFKKVEIDAKFPGGPEAWQRYIQRAITAQLNYFTDGDYGTCTVQFIVDKNGNVSDVQALTLPGTKLAEIAVNTIRKGPKWIPAVQNGHYVSAYRLQPVTLLNPNN
ncbi:MAG: energy transducer TonB [Ginsengibacter sp.]